MSKANLYRAIILKLREDTGDGSLVDLTGHSSRSMRIGRQAPNVKDRTPYLGIWLSESVPLIGSDVTHVQTTRVHFRASARDELIAIRIADRMERLLHSKSEDDPANSANLSFLDFSDDAISNRMTRYKSTRGPDYDADTDVWDLLVEADLIWVDQPCPTE